MSESIRRPIPILILFLSTSLTLKAQVALDTTKSYTPETWKHFEPGLRLGVGIQRSFFFEAGLSLQRFTFSRTHGFAAATVYTSFEFSPSSFSERPIYGVKVGGELVNSGATGGLEVKYLSNGIITDWMITPRIGFGFGVVNLLYGYNFSTNRYPLASVGMHQFSLVINTNYFVHHWREDRRKSTKQLPMNM